MKRQLLVLTCLIAALGLKAQPLRTCRYWYDKDIGDAVTTSFNGNSWQTQLDVGSLSNGLHTLHIQAIDSMQNLMPTKSFLFMKLETNNTANLSYRCWFDQDDESQQTASLGNGAFLMNVSELASGLHTVHIMVEGSTLTHTKSYLFLKPDAFSFTDLTYHYWFDQDMDHQQTGTFENGSLLLNVADLSNGIHTLHLQVEGSTISTIKSYMFMKVPSPVGGDWQFHCWFDQNSSPMQTGPVSSGVFTVDVSGLSIGSHEMILQLDNGSLTSPQSYSFYRTPMITVNANPTEGGTVTLQQDNDNTCTLTATANAGYDFVNWTTNGSVVSTDPVYSFTVTEDAVYEANFVLKSYNITAGANPSAGGTVEGSGTYAHGTYCTLTATANAGYDFVNWTTNGSVVSTNPVYSFTVTEGADYVANFQQQQPQSYVINVSANPTAGGTVTGGGTYTHGTYCTLTAIPNAGYTFNNWTSNGQVVSTEVTYTFTVTESASYVANFTEVSNENHWDYDINAYPGTMSVNAIIEIDGIEQFRTDLEVGAFCGDECRGTMRASDEFYYPDLMPHYYLFLTIHGDNGDQITFRIYDHSLNQELDLTCANTLTFVDNATIGDFDEPYAINFRNAITQTTNFRSGWNWWSSYVDLSDINGLAMLEEGLGSAGVQIKSQSKFVINYGTTWLGGLNAITNEQTLKVQVNAPVTVELTSKPVSPADYPLTLNAGWNWIGYPCTNSLSVANAFSNYTPSTGDQVKTQASYAIYRAGIGWIGALRTINPGDGLFFYTSTGGTLVFPNGSRDTELAENITADNNHWVPDMNAYSGNMTVMAVVELEDVELQSERYELAAFANGEVRGSARLMYVEPMERYMAFLTITGDEAANLTFGLYDTETGTECLESDDLLVFTADAMVGELESPMVVSFRGTTGLSDLERSLQVYPNPVNRGERFALTLPVGTKVQVEVVNALGVVVETLRATSIQAPASPGVYTLRITVDGKGTISRKLVVR